MNYGSEESKNLINAWSSDDVNVKNGNWASKLRKIKNEPLYILAKSLVEVIIVIVTLIYFLILRYLDVYSNWKYLLYPIISFCFVHMIFIWVANISNNWIKELVKNSLFVLICIMHIAVISFSLYEWIESYDEQIGIIIGFGMWFRIMLFYILTQSLVFVLMQKWKKSNKLGIELIDQISNLEKLLNDILTIIQTKDDIENAESKRSLMLAQSIIDLLRKKNEVSIKIDQHFKVITETSTLQTIEFRDINKTEIDKKILEIYSHNKSYFKDVFDFISMEKEVELKKQLDGIRDLEFDIFELKQKSSGNELFLTIMHLMQIEGYITDFDISQK